MKKNILFLIESLSGGGAEKILSILVSHLNPEKFNITLCCIVNKGIYIDKLPAYINYTYILSNPDKLGFWSTLSFKIKYKLIYSILPLKLVYKWFIPKHADIEIAFVEGFATRIIAHSTTSKARQIAWVHTDLINNHWITQVYKSKEQEKEDYSRFSAIVGVSGMVCNALKKQYGLSDKIIQLNNPIDADAIIKLSLLPIKSIDKNKNIRFVSVGRLENQKGYDRLLNIVYRLKQESYNVELWLLGDGTERNKLMNYISQHKLETSITLWGFQANPYALMKQCDLFVCSSICEGYSTAVTEAVILGLPVITTDCSGMNEILQNGQYGIITKNSEEALYQGIKGLLDSPNQLAYYKKQSELRSKDFRIESLIKPIEDFLYA